MEYTPEEDNPWTREAPRDEEAERVSAEIDKKLRQDRINSLKTCQVLVITPPTSDEERIKLVEMIVEQPGIDMKEVESGIKVSRDGIEFQVSSFPTAIKHKLSKVQLANADPTLLVYATSLVPQHVESGEEVVHHLESSLKHCISALGNLGTSLDAIAVQLVLTNTNKLSQVIEVDDFSEHSAALSKWFPLVKNELSIASLVKEFEAAVQSFHPHVVDTLQITEQVEHSDGQAEGLEKLIVDRLVGIQQGRIKEAREKSLKSVFITYPMDKKKNSSQNNNKDVATEKEKSKESVDRPVPEKQGSMVPYIVALISVLIAIVYGVSSKSLD